MITEDSLTHMTGIFRDHAIGLGLVAIGGIVAVTSVPVVADVAVARRHSDAFP
jgi:hypothetical protein